MQKSENGPETPIQTLRIYSRNIGIEFGTGKYAMLITKIGKGEITVGTELPNQERDRTLREKENYKFLRILEPDTVKQVKMKKKKKKKEKKKSAPQMNGKTFWNQALQQKSHWRNKHSDNKILGTIPKIGKGGTLTK